MRQARKTFREVMTGILIWWLAAAFILVIVAEHKPAMAAGVTVGSGTAVLLLWHMLKHLDIALDMEPKHAGRHAQGAAIQRIAVMAVVLAVSMYFYRYIHPVGTVLGIFGLKIGAFMQPGIHQWHSRRKKV